MSITIKDCDILQIHSNNIINKLLYTGLKGYESTIKKILYELYKDSYAYCNKKWYYYNGIYWEIENIPIALIKGVEEIATYYSDMYYQHLLKDNLNTDILEKMNKIIKSISTKLLSVKNNYIFAKAAKIEFTVKKFDEKLDRNEKLRAFNNGIYEIDTCIFRSHSKDDYITKCLNYDYA
jgi:phage/plasmid-associated DNA primase